LLGRKGEAVGFLSVYAYLFFCLGNYFIVIRKAIQSIFIEAELCAVPACLIGFLFLLPTNQLRTLHHLAFLSVVSFVTIVLVLAFCIGALVLNPSPRCGPPIPNLDFWEVFNALSGFVFAFSGQQIFLEIQAEMCQPKDFTKSLNVAFGLLSVAYALVAVGAYGRCGDHTPTYLLDVLPHGGSTRIAAVLMLIHIVVSYTISSQVLTRAILLICGGTAGLEPGIRGRGIWFCLTTSIAILAMVLSNAIPLFDDFVAIIGALLSSNLAFVFPTALFLVYGRKVGVGRIARCTCFVVMVLGAVFCVCGTFSNLAATMRDAGRGGGHPFACNALY